MPKATILVVEDDGIIAAHIHDMLTELGYRVPRPVATGEAALAAVVAQRPDLVLMDIDLAGPMDGTVAAAHIRAEHSLPVVFLTAYSQDARFERALATAPYGYLVKPVDARELAVTVEVALYRHAFDRQLQASEERYRTLVENVPGAVYRCAVEPPRRATFLSEGVLAISGVPAAEFIAGRVLWTDLVPPDDLACANQVVEAAVAQRTPFEIQYRIRHADGSLRWVHDVGRCSDAPDGAPLHLDGVMVDITDRQQAEDALRRREREFANLADNSPDFIVRFDTDLRYLYSNPAAQRDGGLSSELSRGRRPSELPLPADVTAFMEQALARVLTSGAEQRVEQAFPTPHGLRWYETRIVPERDEHGRIESLLAISRDITERKQAEAERLEMERQLLHTQKLESLGVLAGGIAHDFNNLLQAMLGNIELALMDTAGLTEVQARLETAMGSARRAADLTRQMLAYAGQDRFVVGPVDLSGLVEENVEMLRTVVGHAVMLDVQLAHPLPYVQADAGQLQQVVMNLITNASEAIGDRPGRVGLTTGVQECDAAYLRLGRLEKTPPPGRYVYLEVTDDGCGMDESTMQRIFDPFFTTKFTGRGLGMAAVLGIVRGHHGDIMLRSEPGRGTTVRVLFPVAPPAGGAVGAARQAAVAPSRLAASGAVLVVDDEDNVRQLVAAWLERLGYAVLTAADGVEALALFDARGADIACVLLDLAMPGLDGVATCAELRRRRPDVKVILCSGYGIDEAMCRFADQGLAGFVQKPFRLHHLRDELERVLRAERA